MNAPAHVIVWRKARCAKVRCRAAQNFEDVCAKCPNGHWGTHIFCRSEAPTPIAPLKDGPGTKLAKRLKKLGFVVCVSCGSMAQKMDNNGPEWCLAHIDEIIATLRENAKNSASNPLRIPFIEWGARLLVRHACR